MEMNVLAAKRKLKVLLRVPEVERDSVWHSEVSRLQQGIEATVQQVTAEAPRQGDAKATAGAPANGKPPTPGTQEQAPVARRELSVQPEADVRLGASADVPAASPVPQADGDGPAPTQQAARQASFVVGAATLLIDFGSRPEYSFYPYLVAFARPPLHLLAALHVALMLRYVFRLRQVQNPLYSIAVYLVRDLLPCLAMWVIALALLHGIANPLLDA